MHNEEIFNFHSSPGIIRMIKSQRIRQARYTVQMGDRRNAYRNSVENLKATDLMEELGVHICTVLTFWRRIFFFQILAHPVFKM